MAENKTPLEQLRQSMSDYVTGKNVDGILYAFGQGIEILQKNSVAVTDQLTLSTAVGKYLNLRLGDVGITVPPDLGMSDFAARNLGITVTAAKQIPEVIHSVLEVFYGPDAVRAYTVSGLPEPYDLTDADLMLRFEDGATKTLVFKAEQFDNVQQATAQETVNAINSYLRQLGVNALAAVQTNFDTGEKFVKIYGSAKGPYSLVQVWGGLAQVQLEFPSMRDTELPSNTTTWQITKNNETSLRFRWDSGPEPRLDQILAGDRVLIYGSPFLDADPDLVGTFTVTNVRPTQGVPSYDTGWFEVEAQVPGLKNSTPDVAPPPNSPGNTYSYTVNQVAYDDLKFYLARRNVPYAQSRYALAFEPAPSLLRVYLPATTNIIERGLRGGAHVHFAYPATEFNGAHGHATDPALQLEVVNEYTLRYFQDKPDNEGTGGTLDTGSGTVEVTRVYREASYTYIVCAEPHGIEGDQQWLGATDYAIGDTAILNGRLWIAIVASGPGNGGAQVPAEASAYWNDLGAAVNRTSVVVDLQVENVQEDDQESTFLGPYTWDTKGTFTLASAIGATREVIKQGDQKNLLLVNGDFPNREGFLLFSLNEDTQEGPVRYLVSQKQLSDTSVPIASISRTTTATVTVITSAPHGAVPGSQVVISGTSNFDGSHVVDTVPADNVYTFQFGIGVAVESTGTSVTVLDQSVSLLSLDPSYRFRFRHDLLSSVSLLADDVAYVPAIDGRDFSMYLTGTADARIFCQDIIDDIVALGINLEVIIIYPSDEGLGNAGAGTDLAQEPPISEAATYVWASSKA